nr:reverse transcriptase domain-containing protein [Tanacetum cinerariifolium]
FPPLAASSRTEGPLVIEAEVGGHVIHRMYVDGGSSMEILYKHCFNQLRFEIRSQMVPATTSLTGFSGETIWPLGQQRLLVIIENTNHSTRAWMNFMIVSMVLIPTECTSVTASSAVSSEERTRPANLKVALHLDFPDQEVAIRGMLSDKGRTELCSILKKNLGIFAWQPSDMTGVPRSVVKHRLNIREGYSHVRQKKRGQAPKRAKAIQAEVQKLVEAGIMREVYYHDWLYNPVMVKKHDGSWRMCVDFTDLNKACPQDCYPLPEIDWKVESLRGYPFKCFLDAYKGYHQIQLAEPDKEKTAFHIGQGVYCYTKIPFDLKNAGATYQRLMDKAFVIQIDRNIEVYVDDLVIKSHTEGEMMRDIEETFRTLRNVNMKLNPKKCSLDGIFCQQCTCKSCGKGAHIGYNCPPKVSIISNPKPCNQTMNNELPQSLPSFDPMCYSNKENSVPCVSKPNFVDESSKSFNPPSQPPIYSCEFCGSNAQYGHYCTPQVLFINPEPSYRQDFNFPQDIHDFQQQYLCCDQCGGLHETFQCQQVIIYEPCGENYGGPHENF